METGTKKFSGALFGFALLCFLLPFVTVSCNQQKVAVGKWLMADPRVLLLDEPTRGVDVAAKSEIHELLRGVAATGVGMLVSSSENDELIQLCDRILVMFRGRIVAMLGYELVEGDLKEGRIEEKQRVNYSPQGVKITRR